MEDTPDTKSLPKPKRRGLLPIGVHHVLESLAIFVGLAGAVGAFLLIHRIGPKEQPIWNAILVIACGVLSAAIPILILHLLVLAKCPYCGGCSRPRMNASGSHPQKTLKYYCESCGHHVDTGITEHAG